MSTRDALPMMTLAFEFSSDVRSVALWADGRLVGTAGESGGRSTHAFKLVRRVLGEASVLPEQVEVIAVGIGPGSYAGIRVGIALAQGWAAARGVRLLGVSSAEAVAEQAREAGRRGRVEVVIDAQRGEVYHGSYELKDAGIRVATPLRLVALSEINAAASGVIVLGWDEVVRSLPGAQMLAPAASAVARLASGRTDFVAGDGLEPIYLRATSFVKAPPPRVVAGDLS